MAEASEQGTADRREEGMDPSLRAFLEDAREASRGEEARDREGGEAIAAMLRETRQTIDAAERSPLFGLRARSTGARRGLALLVAALMVAVAGFGMTRVDLDSYPSWRLALEVGTLGLLLVGSLLLALRPLHRPELPRWATGLGAGLALLATFAIAAMPPSGAMPPEEGVALLRAPGCMVFGLLFGLPIYALLRALDRGPDTGAILAACAAGLAGNLALHLHCATPVAEHMLAGHFSVALLFVGGILLIRAVDRRLRAGD